jgi:hypothetical protein
MAETKAQTNNIPVKFKGKPERDMSKLPKVRKAHKRGLISKKQMAKLRADG